MGEQIPQLERIRKTLAEFSIIEILQELVEIGVLVGHSRQVSAFHVYSAAKRLKSSFGPPVSDPQPVVSEHWFDKNENPDGGTTFGTGFAIGWQRGPLGQGEERKKPNGAFVENIIIAAIDRLKFYQKSKFNCRENAEAIGFLREALKRLNERTARRKQEGTEGTHEI
jgi:hypothetical protein